MNCTHLYENAAIKILPLFLHQSSGSFFLYSKVSTHDPTQLLPREICCHYFVLVLVINTLRKCSSWCSRGGYKIRILDVKLDFLAKTIWIVIQYLHVHYLNCLCSRNATKWQKYNKYLLLFYWPSILPECCNMLHIHITIGRKYESLLVL